MKRVAIFLALFLLSACEKAPKIDQCWAPQTKKDAESLAKKLMVDRIQEAEDAGMPKAQARTSRGELESGLKASLRLYYVKSVDRNTGNMECGAWVTVTMTAPDQSHVSTDEMELPFELVSGEEGKSVVMSKLPFNTLLADLTKKMAADTK